MVRHDLQWAARFSFKRLMAVHRHVPLCLAVLMGMAVCAGITGFQRLDNTGAVRFIVEPTPGVIVKSYVYEEDGVLFVEGSLRGENALPRVLNGHIDIKVQKPDGNVWRMGKVSPQQRNITAHGIQLRWFSWHTTGLPPANSVIRLVYHDPLYPDTTRVLPERSE